MDVLIVNCGSSSLSFKVYQITADGQVEEVLKGKARNVATLTKAKPVLEWQVNGVKSTRESPLSSHQHAARAMLSLLHELSIPVDAVGHRFVHGGDLFQRTTLINEQSLNKLKQVLPLAPIHNPNSFSAIEVCLEGLEGVPEFVTFDTAFHSTMPIEAREYALPRELAEPYGLRKYGFHGLSYQYVSARAAALLKRNLDDVKLIMCHLGTGGSSVCAFDHGHSVDTSMGFSPLAGLVMSTRCGDIDAEVALELVRQGRSADEVSRLLNHQSGLLGLSDYSSNLSEIIEAAEAGNERCRTAYEVYADRLSHYIGAYTWKLQRADAIVFTDDIGMSSWKLRQKVCGDAEAMGVHFDAELNRAAPTDGISFVNKPDSPTKVIIIPTDEDRIILEEVMRNVVVNGG